MNDPVVDFRDLLVRRGGRTILEIEHWSLRAGQMAVLLGLNGAGKTTLLKTLFGEVRPNRGEIRAFGHPMTRRWGVAHSRLRTRIGYVPQVLAAQCEMPLTVREVVAIGRTGAAGLFRPLSRRDWTLVDESLETFGLAGLAEQTYASLSGGEQRKTLIAKAMVQQPEILLLDEPTANLDLFWREQIVAVLDALHADRRLAILLVCHELEVIPSSAARLLVMQDGRITADGRPHEVLTAARVESLYGPAFRLAADGGRYSAMPTGGTRHA